MNSEKSYVSRVNQLDSDLLDNEIRKIVHEQLANVYKELPPGVLSKFQPEIDCLLKSLIWYCSIHRNNSTFGQQILAITYQKDALTKNKQIIHFLLTIVAPYAKEVGQHRLTNHLRIQKAIAWAECLVRIFTLINFFRFLRVGVHPSLMDYCLQWNHVSQSSAKMRNVGYAYMNRELIWTGFLELLNVTIPLVNFHALKRKVNSVLKPSSDQQIMPKQEPVMNINTKCAICTQRPSIPHHINCRHLFCYFCLKASVMAYPKFQCPLCDYQLSGEVVPFAIKFVD